ncbi:MULTISPECIES: GNAT family N-acetyltransferase [unclassified Brevibacterium]|uniref:GNAT family N-acetyltransferase n=1 Tax=unclassified Brevibacterium TaxID=2614124 RepID=UPI0036455041
MTVDYQLDDRPTRDELLALYESVGWSNYTTDPDRLVAAIHGSRCVVTARNDGQLCGLARMVGDGATIAYLQDVLVAPDPQRQGIGRSLVSTVFEKFEDVRQKVLVTDDEPRQHDFYRSLGFADFDDTAPRLHGFIKLS